MLIPNHKKVVSKLKKEDAVVANQCTCSNCNCRAINKMVNLFDAYQSKLAKMAA